MGSHDAQSAALAAKPARAGHGYKAHRNGSYIGCAGPDQSSNPADYRPAKEEIQQENSASIGLIAANNGRQEVQEAKEAQKQHGAPLFNRQP